MSVELELEWDWFRLGWGHLLYAEEEMVLEEMNQRHRLHHFYHRDQYHRRRLRLGWPARPQRRARFGRHIRLVCSLALVHPVRSDVLALCVHTVILIFLVDPLPPLDLLG